MTKSTGKYVERGAIFDFATAAVASKTDDCLAWHKPNTNGYSSFSIGGRKWLAHRYVCIMSHGEPPFLDADVAHGCGNPACLNPKHLRWATHSENLADMKIHGTNRQGDQMPMAKLNDTKVAEILRLARRVPQRQLAERYGVTQSVISMIQTRKIWKHVQAARHDVKFHEPETAA